jgi:hypothetical protein
MNVLCALNEKDSEDAYIVAEFAAIKDSALVMQQGGFRDLFTMDEDRNFHRVVLAYVNQVFQQISGINLITYYAASIYETSIQLSPFLARILAAANGTEYLVLQVRPPPWLSSLVALRGHRLVSVSLLPFSSSSSTRSSRSVGWA